MMLCAAYNAHRTKSKYKKLRLILQLNGGSGVGKTRYSWRVSVHVADEICKNKDKYQSCFENPALLDELVQELQQNMVHIYVDLTNGDRKFIQDYKDKSNEDLETALALMLLGKLCFPSWSASSFMSHLVSKQFVPPKKMTFYEGTAI